MKRLLWIGPVILLVAFISDNIVMHKQRLLISKLMIQNEGVSGENRIILCVQIKQPNGSMKNIPFDYVPHSSEGPSPEVLKALSCEHD